MFLGTPDFAVPALTSLLVRPDLVEVVAVYTQPDRPSGRGNKQLYSAVKDAVMSLPATLFPIFQPENINDPAEVEKFVGLKADLAIVVAYAQFLGSKILNGTKHGCFNIHGSLLPKYRGASPIQSALLNGEKETGISIIKLVKKMDAGPIVFRQKMMIEDPDTSQTLFKKLSDLGANCLLEFLEFLAADKLQEEAQDESLATYTRLIEKADGKIQWDQSAATIWNQIRAYDPWPGTYATLPTGNLKIKKAIPSLPPIQLTQLENLTQRPVDPGTVFADKGALIVKCGVGWLELLEVQLEGRKVQSAKEFLNGYKKELVFQF